MDKYERTAKERREAIGNHWYELDQLRRMTNASLIEHALFCQEEASDCLRHDILVQGVPASEERLIKWSAYGNQVALCLMVLHERGVYEDDPTRDNKTPKFLYP